MQPKTREVLMLKANGKLSKQIAAELGIHRRTVEWHLEKRLRKNELEAKVNTVHAVAIALRDKLILASEIGCIVILCWSGLTGDSDLRRGPVARNMSRTARRENIG